MIPSQAFHIGSDNSQSAVLLLQQLAEECHSCLQAMPFLTVMMQPPLSGNRPRLQPVQSHTKAAGQAMLRLNQNSLSKNDPHLKTLKGCLDQVCTFR